MYPLYIALAAVFGLQAVENQDNLKDIGVEAYIYGYPLVTMDVTRQVTTNTVKPGDSKAPMGQFVNLREFPNPKFTDVTAPNADTLYSAAWLDLSNEPYVFHTPDENGRFFLMEMLDAWTNVIASPGSRTTGEKAADYVITGPDWQGTLPSGLKEIKSPTNLVWIIGRTYTTGTPEDYKEVHAIQDLYSLVPLSSYGKPYTAPLGHPNPSLDMKTSVRDQVNNLDSQAYFQRLAQLMKQNPPAKEDAPILAKMEKIGLVPGQDFKGNADLKDVPKLALEKIISHEKDAGKLVNGWTYLLDTGNYGTNYLNRAFVTFVGLGANLPQDAVYPTAFVDGDGKALNGQNKYLLHFNKGELPPVKGFWSLTMYNQDYFFVENPLNRYSIGTKNQFKTNEDGSVDIYIQNSSPGAEKESNWLPAPEGDFKLMLRFYWPEESILNLDWKPPLVKKV